MEMEAGYSSVRRAISHIAAQMADDTPLTSEERDFLGSLYPLENGKWAYNPYHIDDLMFVDLMQGRKKWEQKEDELTALAIRLFRCNPAAGLRHVLASATYIWCITGPMFPDNFYMVAFLPGGS